LSRILNRIEDRREHKIEVVATARQTKKEIGNGTESENVAQDRGVSEEEGWRGGKERRERERERERTTKGEEERERERGPSITSSIEVDSHQLLDARIPLPILFK